MRRMASLATVAGLLAAATAAQAVTLRYQGEAGEVRRYAFAASMRMQSEGEGEQARTEGTITGLLAQKINSVDNGVLTIEQKVTKGKMAMRVEGSGEPINREMPEVKTLMKMDAQGHVKYFKADDTAMMMSPTQGFDRALAEIGMFPERDLKVGDTWSSDREVPDADIGTIKLRLTRKLVALEPQDKHDCAKVETKFEGTLEPTAEMMGSEMLDDQFDLNVGFSGTVVTWFDHRDGLIVREDVTMRMLTTMHFTMPAMGAGEDVEHSSRTAMIMNARTALQK